MTGAPPPAPDLPVQLMQLLTGAWVTQMLHVAAELGLADRLVAGPRPVDDLARDCGADADGLFRLLRGLASVGVFTESEPGSFGLSPLASMLRTDHPTSMAAMARMLGGEHYEAWDDLLHSVRTGEPAFRHRFGCSVFEHYRRDPERGAVFDAAMTDFSRQETAAFLEAYPFEGLGHVADVGGGLGSLLMAVLERHPPLRGTLFDQPEVVAPVRVPPHLAGRLRVEGGDFFAGVPAGADAYLLKHILHDWDDGACVTILGHIRDAMAPGGRVLILEQVIPPGNDPFPGKLLDLNMLVMTEGGRERTPSEYAALLAKAGLRLGSIVPTASPVGVVEAFAA